MEFIALGILALVLGVRGMRADRRAYIWSVVAAVIAALYTFKSQ